jgi:4-alpha-glucanotransferase
VLRGFGVLLPVFSLPGGCHVGDMGPEAYGFAQFLADAEATYWQVLPLGHTAPEYDDSPYSAISLMAGNPPLISLDKMAQDGLLTKTPPRCSPAERADYEAAWGLKRRYLQEAFEAGLGRGEFEEFAAANGWWLEPYGRYMALRETYGSPWVHWPPKFKRPGARLPEKIAKRALFYQYVQYVFWSQWLDLKRHVNSLGVFIIGDLPIYPGHDSADVWEGRRYFKLAPDGTPLYVSGVPPDYFSPTGQLWRTPVYDWGAMRRDRYAWWARRLRRLLEAFDHIRLDHFRGYAAYWEVPYGEETAVNGRWAPGPGEELFRAVEDVLPRLIAEDLGLITPDVVELRRRLGIPGMRVLQFAWDGNPANEHKPHNYERDLVAYTGTHDNNTIVGWWLEEATPRARREALAYMGGCRGAVNWCFARLLFSTVADAVVVPIQDVLGLGGDARINKPATPRGNWKWRLHAQPPPAHARRLRRLAKLYGR